MSLIEQIDKNRLPQHVAIIMDGNGRWAKAKGKDRSYGHQEGVVSVRKVVEEKPGRGLELIKSKRRKQDKKSLGYEEN